MSNDSGPGQVPPAIAGVAPTQPCASDVQVDSGIEDFRREVRRLKTLLRVHFALVVIDVVLVVIHVLGG